MANVFIQDSTMSAIGDAIRAKTGGTDKLLPADMAAAISGITTGGGGSEGFSLNPVFAENDWIMIAAACVLNQVPDTWAVGNQKAMTIGGTDYTIDIIGKNHDTYTAGGNKAPLTFQMHGFLPTIYTMNTSKTNIGGYDSSNMFTTHLPAIKKLIPSDIQAAIRHVNKKSTIGGDEAFVNTSTETISCDLFLLSRHEVFGDGVDDGPQYDYYTEETKRIKYDASGAGCGWWLRSPYTSDAECFDGVTRVGTWGTPPANATQSSGWADWYVSFAFCF